MDAQCRPGQRKTANALFRRSPSKACAGPPRCSPGVPGRPQGCPGWRFPAPAGRRHRRSAAGQPEWPPGRPGPGQGRARGRPAGRAAGRHSAEPTVAPTTRPDRAEGSPSTCRSPPRRLRTIRRATESVPPTCCTEAPSGLEVSARTNTPRPYSAARSRAGRSDSKPRYGLRVTESAARRGAVPEPGVGVGGHGGADVAALGVCDGQHLASAAAASSSSRTAMPAEPWRS